MNRLQERNKAKYIEGAIRILELETAISELCENIKYTPYGQLTPLMDTIMMKKLEVHTLRNKQKDIEYKCRTIGGLAI